ncbi:MAG: hypothetical protein WKF52_05755 [Sphingomicrobium sp.]
MSAQVQRLLACRSIADPAPRVLCFDREALAVDEAIQRKQLVVVDRATANATRRSLFGFGAPNLGNLFGNEQNQVREIQSTVARATYRGLAHGWTITLADGSVWAQTDDSPLALAPRKGDKILVQRGVLGSYNLSVSGQPGVKVRRIG